MTPRSRSLVPLLGALTGLTALSIDMSLPALPTLAAVFSTSAEQAALTLSTFLAGYSVSQLFYGPLSDRFGRRPPLLLGLILYAAGGVGCVFSSSMAQLLFWRLVQGVGACAGPILARAVVRDLYERTDAIRILSYMTMIMSAAPLLAPILGGYLLRLGWRAIFAGLAAIGLAVLVATWAGLEESVKRRDPHATRVLELTRNLFDFLRRPVCIGHALLVCFVFCGLFAYISSSSFVFIEVFGIPSDRFGYLFGLSAFALMTGAGINSRLAHRIRPGIILRLGVGLVAAGGAAIIVCAALRAGGAAGIIGPILIYVLGMSMVMPHAIAAAMEPVPHMAGFASSLIGALQTVGGAFVAYIVGALYNRTALPLALGVGISAALAGAAYFIFLDRLAAAPPSRPSRQGDSEC